MKSKLEYFLSFSVFILAALLFFARSVNADEAKFIQDSVAASEILQKTLIPGVDLCFNPEHGDAMKGAKSSLQGLLTKIDSYRQQAVSNLPAVEKGLVEDLGKFNKHQSIFCGTTRECLAEGFRPDPKYPNCSPKNLQLFNELLDHVIPAMITDAHN